MIDFEKRRRFIGGSDCAAALGLSSYKTKYELWLEKISDEYIPPPETEQQYWGKKHEPNIIDRYEKETGNKCSRENLEIINPKYPWLIAHVDAWVIDKPLILECKSTRYYSEKWGESGTDDIPDEYVFQCAHYCLVCEDKNLEGVDIAALGSTSDFRLYHYKRNIELEKIIAVKTKEFWQDHMIDKIPPNPTESDDLARIYKIAKRESVLTATNDVLEKIENIKELKTKIKQLAKEEELLENAVKLIMKDNEILIDISGQKLASWKNSERKSLDINKLKKANLYDDYLKTSSIRTFKLGN